MHAGPDEVRVAWVMRRGNFRVRHDPIMRLLEEISGVPATLTTANGTLHAPATADVLLVNHDGSRDILRQLRKAHSAHAIFLFINSEPIYNGDNFVDLVDVCFGQAPAGPAPSSTHPLCRRALAAPNFVRTPLWLLYVMARWGPGTPRPRKCQIRGELTEASALTAERWLARPRLAIHVARHDAFPRRELRRAFDSAGTRARYFHLEQNSSGDLAARNVTSWRVDIPGQGKPHYNMPWPQEFGDDNWGKLKMCRQYRYSIQPENTRTPCNGFFTEKLVVGHMAGAIPVHWGDSLEEGFWNPARVLVLDADAGNLANLTEYVYALETDADARAEFFSRPILAPGAEAMVQQWCDAAEAQLRRAFREHKALGARFPRSHL